jgi:hypothetical protein
MFRVFVTAVMLLSATFAHAQSTQRGFSVVLLLGETQPAASGDGLPPAPALRKALNDVKDFLPYKSYRVLDTQWLRGGSTRMKGVDDQEYDVDLIADEVVVPSPVPNSPSPAGTRAGTLNVLFKLKEVGAAENSSEEYGRSIQVADMEKQRAHLVALLPAAQGAMAQEQKARIEQLDRQIRLAKARRLIDSRFQMAVGETVVVGTSKVGGGDRGLVVLLTSVVGGR